MDANSRWLISSNFYKNRYKYRINSRKINVDLIRQNRQFV